MAEDLNAMNLDAELLQLESSFIGAQSAKQSLLEALTEANNRLASNALETVRVPDMQEEQGLGSSSPLLQLEARLQASKIRQAQMEAQVQERGDKIRQLETELASESYKVYHAEHRIHAAMAETEAACTQLAESQAAAVVLVEALRKATASAASLGGATAAELTSGAESVLQSMQAATARMQHMSNLQAAAKAELGSDGSADSLPAAASSLQHMAPAIREMQGDALRLREELEAARAREVELNTELAAAQECFKMLEAEVTLLQQEQKQAAQRLHTSQEQLRSAQSQLQLVRGELSRSGGAAAAIVGQLDRALSGINGHVQSMDEYLKGLADQEALESRAAVDSSQEPRAQMPSVGTAFQHSAASPTAASSPAEQQQACEAECERLRLQLDITGADVAVLSMQYEEAAAERDQLGRQLQEALQQLQQVADNQEALLQQMLVLEEEKDALRGQLQDAAPALQMLAADGAAGLLLQPPPQEGSDAAAPAPQPPHEVLQGLLDELLALQAMAAAQAMLAPMDSRASAGGAQDQRPGSASASRGLTAEAVTASGSKERALAPVAADPGADVDLHARLLALQAQHASLIQAAATERQQLEAKLEEKQAQLLELHAGFEQIEKHAVQVEDGHAQRVADLHTQLQAAQHAASDAEALHVQLEGAEAELSAIHDAHALAMHSLREELEAAVQAQASLGAELEQLQQEKENFELESRSFKNRSDFMAETIQSLREELKAATERAAKAEAKVTSTAAAVAALQGKVASLTAADADAGGSSRGAAQPVAGQAGAARSAARSLIPPAPGVSPPRGSLPTSPPAGPSAAHSGTSDAALAAAADRLRAEVRSAEDRLEQQAKRHAEEVGKLQKQVAELTAAQRASTPAAPASAAVPAVPHAGSEQGGKGPADTAASGVAGGVAELQARLQQARARNDALADQLAQLAMQAALAEVQLDELRASGSARGSEAGESRPQGGAAPAELMIEAVALHGEVAQLKDANNKLESQLQALCGVLADSVAAAALQELQQEAVQDTQKELEASVQRLAGGADSAQLLAEQAAGLGQQRARAAQLHAEVQKLQAALAAKERSPTPGAAAASQQAPGSSSSSKRSSSAGGPRSGRSSSSSGSAVPPAVHQAAKSANTGLLHLAHEKRVSLSEDSPALEHLGTLRVTPLSQAQQLHAELRIAADALQQGMADGEGRAAAAAARQSLSQLQPAVLAALHIADGLVAALARQEAEGASAARSASGTLGAEAGGDAAGPGPAWLPGELARMRKAHAESSAFHDSLRQDMYALNQRLWVWGCNLRAQLERLERDTASAAYVRLADPDKAVKKVLDAKDASQQRLAQELDEVKSALQAAQAALARRDVLVAGLERQLVDISDDVCRFEMAVVTCEVLSSGLKQKVEQLEAEQAEAEQAEAEQAEAEQAEAEQAEAEQAEQAAL